MLALFLLAAALGVATPAQAFLPDTTGTPVETTTRPAAAVLQPSPLEGEVVYTTPSSPYFVLDGQLHALPSAGQPTSDYRALYTEPGRINHVSATQTFAMPLGDQFLSVVLKLDARTKVPFLVVTGTLPNPLDRDTAVIVRPITPAGMALYKFSAPTETANITCNPGPAGFPPPGAALGTGALPPAVTKC
jgi:hypothetical protein